MRFGYGGGDLLRPWTHFSGSVQGAHLVVVGGAGGRPGVAEGRAGEVVAADLLPAGLRVPPGPEFVACGAGYGCPAQFDGAFCGLCAQFGS